MFIVIIRQFVQVKFSIIRLARIDRNHYHEDCLQPISTNTLQNTSTKSLVTAYGTADGIW
jgi:hypothetical protein